MKLILSGMIFLSRLTLLFGRLVAAAEVWGLKTPIPRQIRAHRGLLKERRHLSDVLTAHNIYSQTEHSISEKHLIFNYLILLLCQKSLGYLRSCSMKIFSKLPTENIVKLNFWLVICIAKNFIWSVPASCSRSASLFLADLITHCCFTQHLEKKLHSSDMRLIIIVHQKLRWLVYTLCRNLLLLCHIMGSFLSHLRSH